MKITFAQYPIPEIHYNQQMGEILLSTNIFNHKKLKIIKFGQKPFSNLMALDKAKPHNLFDFMLLYKDFSGVEIVTDTFKFLPILKKGAELASYISQSAVHNNYGIDIESPKLIYNMSASISTKSAMSVPAFHLHINTFSTFEKNKLKTKTIDLKEFDPTLEFACNIFEEIYPHKTISISKSKAQRLGIGVNIITNWRNFSEINCLELANILKDIHHYMLKLANIIKVNSFDYGITIYKHDEIYILIQPKYGTSIGAAGAMMWNNHADLVVPKRGNGSFSNKEITIRRQFQTDILNKF